MEKLAQLKRDLTRTREQKNCEGELAALLALGTAYNKKGQRKLTIGTRQEAATLLTQLGRHREASDLYRSMAATCEEMNHRQKAARYYLEAISCLQHVGNITVQDLSTMARSYENAASLEGHCGYLDTAHMYYLFARETYRVLGDLEKEALCWLSEANVWCDRSDYGKGLGYASFGLDVLKQVTPPVNLEEVEQRHLSLREWLQTQYDERIFQMFVQESEEVYAIAASEAENERKKREERLRDLTRDVKRMGLLHDIRGRKEPEASEAIHLIQTHGLRQSAISDYERAKRQFRSQHNRLGEALIVATIALISQVKRSFSSTDLNALLSLYRDADQDILGQLRALYNYGIGCSLQPSKNLQSAVAYVHCVLLGMEHHPQIQDKALKTQGEKRMAVWKQQLDQRAYQQALQRGMDLFTTHLATPHLVHISIAPLCTDSSRFWMHEEQNVLKVAEVPHLLAATRIVLNAIIEEASLNSPAQREWEAKRQGEDRILFAGTSGYRLFLGEKGAHPESHFHMRFLQWHLSTDQETQGFVPLSYPSSGAESGIQEYTYDDLLKQIIDYLDHPLPDDIAAVFFGRAVELLNDDDQIVGCMSWDRRCHSRLASVNQIEGIERESRAGNDV